MRLALRLIQGLCFSVQLLRESTAAASGTALPSRIVVADDASESELWAAAKLADLLLLPVDNTALSAATAQIAVGHGAATTLGVPSAALDALGDDTYLVSTKAVPAGSVAIASGAHSARGTVYGSFAFLRQLGFEFFAEVRTNKPSYICLHIKWWWILHIKWWWVPMT